MMNKKYIPSEHDYSYPQYRKVKDIRVTTFLNLSKKSLSGFSKLNSISRKNLKERIRLITYFHSKTFADFIIKYRVFVCLTLNVNVDKHIDYLITRWERLCMENGPLEALKIFKDLYSIGSRITTSNAFTPMSFRKSNKRGEPKLFGPILSLLKGTLDERRAALAVLSLIKVVEFYGSDYSIKTILKEAPIPLKSFEEFPKVGDYFKRFMEKNGRTIDQVDVYHLRKMFFRTLEKEFPQRQVKKRLNAISELSTIHISGRNGPNGPCLSTAICDWESLQNNNCSELLYNIKKMSYITKNEQLLELMDSFEGETSNLTTKTNRVPIHSRISLKGEPWGRLRPFAICDYFSQSSLCGLHTYLFRWLESQEEDGTYTQDRVSEEVRKWTLESSRLNSCESADLSAATDSIPVEVQGEILSQIAGQEFARIWVNVVSNRTFEGPDGEQLRYSTGQPMGILSSWGMLAVWHHIMVRTCQAYLNKPKIQDQCDYYIIGDDIAMRGQDLFAIYETIVDKIQGVGISKLKGFHKETQSTNYPILESHTNIDNSIHTAELAKRIYCNGVELSIVPPNEVLSTIEDLLQFPELFSSMKIRGYKDYNNIQSCLTLSQTFYKSQSDKNKALTLALCPIKESPLISEDQILDLLGNKQYSKIFWFTPKYSRSLFIEQLIGSVMLTMASSVPTTFMAFSQWETLANSKKPKAVKSWVYSSDSQNLLLNMVITKCKGLFFQILMGRNLAKSFPKGEPINWSLLRRTLQSFQTLVEIDYVYTDSNRVRNSDRVKYMTSFLSTEIRKAIKIGEQTDVSNIK